MFKKMEREKTIMIDGRLVRPDFIIDFGDRGCIVISLEQLPETNKNGSPMVSELEIFYLLNSFVRKASKKSPCSFSFLEHNTQVFISYDKSKRIIGFTGYEAIICKRCFSNPANPINGRVLFDDFKALKKENSADIFVDEYKQQVRSATERVNRKLKDFFDIKDDILIYSSIPQVVVNSIFLK